MDSQFNKISGKDYEGANQINLQEAKALNNYESNAWVTFLQARELGMKVKKGSHGVSVFKGFGTIQEIGKDKKLKTKSAPLGFAKVFNFDQLEKGKEVKK